MSPEEKIRHHRTQNGQGNRDVKHQHRIPQVVEALVHVVQTRVDMNKVLFPRLFGMRQSLLHALLDTEKTFVHVFRRAGISRLYFDNRLR